MSKIYIQNLAMIVTEKCNLNCRHCLMGECKNKSMSDEVIRATLDQIAGIGNINLCGGEITLAPDTLEKIFYYIQRKKILVDQFTLFTNGTIYSEKMINVLNNLNEYTKLCTDNNSEGSNVLAISYDKYHLEEIKRLGLIEQYRENINKYSELEYYSGFNLTTKKLFREGRACDLPKKETVPLRAPATLLTYAKGDTGLCNIGPIITINVDGIITEPCASIINQRGKYNYGNVLKTSIESSCHKRNVKVLKPKPWIRATEKEIKKYLRYSH